MALEADLDATVVGDQVAFEFTVRNTGEDEVVFEFRSGKKADFVVSDNDEEVWRWSDGRMFTQMLESETLAPDESVVYTGTWTEPPPGTFSVTGTLEASNVTLDGTSTISIP